MRYNKHEEKIAKKAIAGRSRGFRWSDGVSRGNMSPVGKVVANLALQAVHTSQVLESKEELAQALADAGHSIGEKKMGDWWRQYQKFIRIYRDDENPVTPQPTEEED